MSTTANTKYTRIRMTKEARAALVAEADAWKPCYVGTEAEANIREAHAYLTPLMDALVGHKGYIKPGCSEAWNALAAQNNELVSWSTRGYVRTI